MLKRGKNIAVKAKNFLKDESGVSGIVVAIALIVIGVLGGYYVYNQNLQPTLAGAKSAGSAIGASGTTAASDWGSVN